MKKTDDLPLLEESKNLGNGHSSPSCRSCTWQVTTGIYILPVIAETKLYCWMGFPWDRRAGAPVNISACQGATRHMSVY